MINEMLAVIDIAEKTLSKMTGVPVKLSVMFDHTVISIQSTEKIREWLIAAVCTEFQVTLQEFHGPNKSRRMSDARTTYIWIAHRHMDLNDKDLAADIGRDRSNVYACLNRAAKYVAPGKYRDPIASKIDSIESRLLKFKPLS